MIRLVCEKTRLTVLRAETGQTKAESFYRLSAAIERAPSGCPAELAATALLREYGMDHCTLTHVT